MSSPAAIADRTRAAWSDLGDAGRLAVAVTLGAVLAVVSWQAGALDANIFGGLQESAIDAGGPGALISIGAALVIGASMIVVPCGYPAVFVVPSILGSRAGVPQRATLTLLFLAGGALPLAALGVALSFAGAGLLDLLDTKGARMTFAVVLYSSLGLLAIAYALSELGAFRLPGLFSRVTSPDLPDQDKPYGRAAVLGATFGAGLGIGCPMPTYYVLLGWVVAAANPAYGAIVLGVYGLGRLLPALGIGALVVTGLDRRRVSLQMTSWREKTSGVTNAIVAALGAYLIVLFGGVVLYRVVTL